jgi:hypothetical protein
MATEAKFKTLLAVSELRLKEIEEFIGSEDIDDVKSAYEQIDELIKRVEKAKNDTIEYLVEQGNDLEFMTTWAGTQKGVLTPFRDARAKIKKQMEKITDKEAQEKLERELHIQQRVNEEQMRFQHQQQKEREEAAFRQQQREQEWYMQKMEMEKRMQASLPNVTQEATAQPSTQSVKLQKYTITPFFGDYKDWLRFWNQFTVEVDGSGISEISKLNYLLELVKGKPKEDILGLPHSVEGYKEAKRILEQTYGKEAKVHKALIKELEGLSAITSIHKISNIHEFYNKLARVVRTLVTMKKLETAQSCVYTLMDKLGPVREILVQKDDNWEEWGLEELTENLRRYVERNPLREEETNVGKPDGGLKPSLRRRETLLFGRGSEVPARRKFSCAYCHSTEHFSTNCTKVLNVESRKSILRQNKMCFNCTGTGHVAAECKSRGCKKCQRKHHTSLCEEKDATLDPARSSKAEKGMSSHIEKTTTLHGTVLAKIGTQTVRVMFDTGAGSSYVCTDVIAKQRLKPVRKERRCIEQMFGTMQRDVEIYNVRIESKAVEGFSLEVKCINAEKDVLTYLPNPNVKKLKQGFPRLRRLRFSEEETKGELIPVHIILGAADYQRVRTTAPPVLGNDPDKDPGAEFTKLGWTMYGQHVEAEGSVEKQFLLQSGTEEFAKLCNLDILGVADAKSENTQIHEEFLEQLTRNEHGHYETRLPWKEDQVPLPMNRNLSKARLEGTVKKLERTGKLQEYDRIMREQIEEGIIEPVPENSTGEKVHYVPHQAVIREKAQTTKMRIVYDCSAKPNAESPSLNDCLKTGPPLQPLLFDILIRNRFRKFCVSGDIQKAFLQIWVHEKDRDAQRILWYNNLEERNVTDYRFTRVIFGATSSPYILGATLQKHVSGYESLYPETTKSLLEDTYVDDIQGGGDSAEQAVAFKAESDKILSEASFPLHKWHSNVESLDSAERGDDEQTYAESSVGNKRSNETKILGVPWNKKKDTFSVSLETITDFSGPLTKRKIISAVNSIYDVLGWTAPVTITAKIIFGEICLLKLHWDEEVPEEIAKKWKTWVKGLKNAPTVTVPRCVATIGQSHFRLHGFADASKLAVCAVIYVVSYRGETPVDRNLLVAKSRVAPKNLSIPRLELVAAHTLAKLQNNVKHALSSFPIASLHNWVDSVTVLYWLSDHGEWSTFVRNRVKKIKELTSATWKYVPTTENPSDLGTRGTSPDKLGESWFKGPEWLTDGSDGPVQPEVSETQEVKLESVKVKSTSEAMFLAEDASDEELEDVREWADELLNRMSYWKLLRVTAYVKRFAEGCRKNKRTGPLARMDMAGAEKVWVGVAQTSNEIRTEMTLEKDATGLVRCVGRIQGYHPIFIPRESTLARRLIEHCHLQSLHGGVAATMSKVREKFWIPKLRSIVKSVVHKCNLCKRYRVKVMDPPITAPLPNFRTEFTEPFTTTGVDFAGPVYYKIGKGQTRKAYIALFTCAATRAVHLSLCREMTLAEFKRVMKGFVARRGTPRLFVSDNARTFQATKKWLSTLARDEDLFNYLAINDIQWIFNMARSPWWGGFFERLIGIMKISLSKTIGRALLKFEELEEVLLDVEVFMNNRPLCYVGEEFEVPVVTPNILLHGQPTCFLEENTDEIGDEKEKLCRRLRYMKTCRQNIRRRWVNEYLHALQERFVAKNRRNNRSSPRKNSVVLLKDMTKHRAKWKLGKVVDTIVGRDGIMRGYKVKTGNGYVIERPLQLVCDLEICQEDVPEKGKDKTGVVNAEIEHEKVEPREQNTRKAKKAAVDRLVGLIANENEED